MEQSSRLISRWQKMLALPDNASTSTNSALDWLLSPDHKDRVCTALDELLQSLAQGETVCDALLPDVLRYANSQDISLILKCYAFIKQVAPRQPDHSLMIINTCLMRSGASNKNGQVSPFPVGVRYLAVRMLAALSVQSVAQVLIVVIKHVLQHDPSVLVRQAAIYTFMEAFKKDKELFSNAIVEEIIRFALFDSHIGMIGPCVEALLAVFNENETEMFNLIHTHYRNWCSQLLQLDSWAQALVMRFLTNYVRNHFTDPNVNPLHHDHRIFLNSCFPLLSSDISDVVVSAATALWYTAPTGEFDGPIAEALMKQLSDATLVEESHILVVFCLRLIRERKTVFVPYLERFFIDLTEVNSNVAIVKCEILALLVTDETSLQVLRELSFFLRLSNMKLIEAALKSIGQIAMNLDSCREKCIEALLCIATTAPKPCVTPAVHALLPLLHKDEKRLSYLVALYPNHFDESARTALLTHLAFHILFISSEALRRALCAFPKEHFSVKRATVFLVWRLYYVKPEESMSRLLFENVMASALNDENVDIREWGRWYTNRSRIRQEDEIVEKNSSNSICSIQTEIPELTNAWPTSLLDLKLSKQGPLIPPWATSPDLSVRQNTNFKRETVASISVDIPKSQSNTETDLQMKMAQSLDDFYATSSSEEESSTITSSDPSPLPSGNWVPPRVFQHESLPSLPLTPATARQAYLENKLEWLLNDKDNE